MLWKVLFIFVVGIQSVTAAENNSFTVFGVNRGLDMGEGFQPPERDLFINMGARHGLTLGMVLEVSRKMAGYDLMGKTLYSDFLYPFAQIKVIHVEGNISIARLIKLLPADTTPGASPPVVMVGDTVRKL